MMNSDNITIRVVKMEDRILSHFISVSFIIDGREFYGPRIIVEDAKDAKDALRILVKHKGGGLLK